jgi:hypothetical protein
MKRTTIFCIAAIALSFGLSACRWVELTPTGEKARVLSADQISRCKKVGLTTVSVKSSVFGIERDEDKVSEELRALARNASEGLGGDTVVPASRVANGSQVFEVYKCLDVPRPTDEKSESKPKPDEP